MTMTAARAQFAVIDVAAVAQIVQEVELLGREVQTAQLQLAQARQALLTMTGDRGMQHLLAGTSRNYLPANWSQLTSAMAGQDRGYAALASAVRADLLANAVLTSGQLASLASSDQEQLIADRQSNALQQALAQVALANASGRFASLQSLNVAIGNATDQKGILDLQARIGVEIGMLQNEQTKLDILQRSTDAADAINRQRLRERIIAGHGQFNSRFSPVPAFGPAR
ncbi:MAG: type IV secretion system protein [Pseudomonadota bacterium]|nr:type IV secretion system protein [Pseudomonadota bacterium]